MFGVQFYPTPAAIAQKMLAPYYKQLRLESWTVLDPSAGSGVLLDEAARLIDSRWKNTLTYAIEIDSELRMILNEKKHIVVGSDFLEFNEPVTYNLVVMNPPFAAGAKHVVHAWQFVQDGGELVALVNWQTIANPFDKYRKLLQDLIDSYGTVENIGRVFFTDCDRSADVEVGLIRLTKPAKQDEWEFSFVPENDQPIITEQTNFADLSPSNPITAVVAQYNAALAALKERHEAQQKLDRYLGDRAYSVHGTTYSREDDKSLDQKVSLANQILILKSRFWNKLFQDIKIESKMPSSFQKKFEQFAAEQSRMAFSEQNIRELVGIVIGSRETIMKETIMKCFDRMTSFHEKNRVHVEGWKTNKAWKINNKKVIYPGAGYKNSVWGGNVEFHRSTFDFLDDLDKAFCWITGTNADNPNFVRLKEEAKEWELQHKFDKTNVMEFESTFFKCVCFKKGTIHIYFKDQEALNKFNKIASDGKNWIGGGY